MSKNKNKNKGKTYEQFISTIKSNWTEIEDQKIKIVNVPIHQDNPHRELKERVRELLELIEHNTTSMWVDNLEYTGECILLEDFNSKEMRIDDECSDYGDTKHEDNYQFTGSKISKLINDLKDLI